MLDTSLNHGVIYGIHESTPCPNYSKFPANFSPQVAPMCVKITSMATLATVEAEVVWLQLSGNATSYVWHIHHHHHHH